MKVTILGAAGYVGEELVRFLYHHPKVEIELLSSHSYVGKSYNEVYPQVYKLIDKQCIEENLEEMQAEIIFMALPYGIASKVIYLDADFRISKDAYDKWYKTEHYGQALLDEAVYGLYR